LGEPFGCFLGDLSGIIGEPIEQRGEPRDVGGTITGSSDDRCTTPLNRSYSGETRQPLKKSDCDLLTDFGVSCVSKQAEPYWTIVPQ